MKAYRESNRMLASAHSTAVRGLVEYSITMLFVVGIDTHEMFHLRMERISERSSHDILPGRVSWQDNIAVYMNPILRVITV